MSQASLEERVIACMRGNPTLSSIRLLTDEIELERDKAITLADEPLANALWALAESLEAHCNYVSAFEAMKSHAYYNAWCLLEKAEISYSFVARHLRPQQASDLRMPFLLEYIGRYQGLFPYRVFMSPELLISGAKCTICGQQRSIVSPCGHNIGDLYMGKMCGRELTSVRVVGCALVTNPHQKYSVCFPREYTEGPSEDSYNYHLLNCIIPRLDSPYREWNYVVSQKQYPRHVFNEVGSDSPCPCNSGKKFGVCCSESDSLTLPHYQFDISGQETALPNVVYFKK